MKHFALSFFCPDDLRIQSLPSLVLLLEGSLVPAGNYGQEREMGSQMEG